MRTDDELAGGRDDRLRLVREWAAKLIVIKQTLDQVDKQHGPNSRKSIIDLADRYRTCPVGPCERCSAVSPLIKADGPLGIERRCAWGCDLERERPRELPARQQPLPPSPERGLQR